MNWDDLEKGKECPFDVPRTEPNDYWDSVVQMNISTLCLLQNQAYRGHCILVSGNPWRMIQRQFLAEAASDVFPVLVPSTTSASFGDQLAAN